MNKGILHELVDDEAKWEERFHKTGKYIDSNPDKHEAWEDNYEALKALHLISHIKEMHGENPVRHTHTPSGVRY